MKLIDMACPKCGATMKPDLSKGNAVCEYCGYQVLIEKEDTLEETKAKAHAKSYGYHKGKLEAEAEASRKEKRRNAKPGIIAIGVIVLIGLISTAVTELPKPKINPFDCIEVSFQGKDGDGEVVLEVKSQTEGVDVNFIDFEISKGHYLTQGETITISATSDEYRLEEKTKTYTVEGLDEYLTDLESIPEDALEIIHLKAESALELNLERSKNVGVFVDMKPVKLFLTTDGKQTNCLYDVFEVHFTTMEGEKTYYVLAIFDDVIVRGGEQVSIDMSGGIYLGHLTQVEGALYIMAYDSVEEIRVDILTSQESQMELKELDL